MALANDPTSIQSSCSRYGNFLGSESSSSSLHHQLSDPLIYRFGHDHQRERDTTDTFVKHLQMVNPPKEYVFDSTNFDHQHEQAYDGSSNFLSFVQNESSPDQESYTKTDNHDRDHDEYSSLWESFNSNSSYGAMMNNSSSVREKVQNGDRDMFGLLLFNEEIDNVEVGTTQVTWNNKRHADMGESMQPLKKQCNGINNTSKKAKPKTVSTKDPQSSAAKNRRERISERLKVLQELVPNGCKVDLVTMLEKAISYVKFLQLQVKVLATDEFWPTQGGKAPEISQVKEAIDVILHSQRIQN